MSTEFRPLEIPPGVVSTPTKKMRSSNWSEVNMLRWRESQLMPMGGQTRLTNVVEGVEQYQFFTTCKMIHGWYGLDGIYYIAYLCEQNLYVDVGGSLFDITPADGIAPPTSPAGGFGDGPFGAEDFGTPRTFSGSIASTRIPNAYSLDNFGSILYAMTSGDGRLLRWDPGVGPPGQVTSATASAFTTSDSVITMGTPNPGSALPGMIVFDGGTGTIVGTVSDWTGLILTLTENSLFDTGGLSANLGFGNLANVQQPDLDRGPVPNGRCFVVTPDRFVMIFGSVNDGTDGGTAGGNARRFAWCDQENPGAWDYANVVSQAGNFDVEPASPIICALSSRVGIIFWTAQKVYAVRFLGLPYVYNYKELADGTTPWSPQSMTTTSSLSLWMSEQGVFSYDGTSVLPVACRVRPWIDDAIDSIFVRELGFAAHLSEFNEWWWFYPEEGAIGNTRAAVYNYKEGWWTQVRMSRSAGITSNYTAHPIFADDLTAFQHEVGNVYDNASTPVVQPFAETFDLNLLNGARLITVKQMLPDVDGDIANLRYSLFYRNSRSLGLPEQQSAPRAVRDDGYVDFRTTGRDVRLRIDVASPFVQHFTLGQFLVDAVPRGDR